MLKIIKIQAQILVYAVTVSWSYLSSSKR